MFARQPLETMHLARRCHTLPNPVAHKDVVDFLPFLVLAQFQHPFLMSVLLQQSPILLLLPSLMLLQLQHPFLMSVLLQQSPILLPLLLPKMLLALFALWTWLNFMMILS